MPVEERDEAFIRDQNIFRRNALQLVNKMLKMSTLKTSSLVDEFLHSIFFLGTLTFPSLSPEDIFQNDQEILDVLKELYPRPFTLYSSQLPRRSPFSCVLDMVVHLCGPDKESIQDKLHELVSNVKQNDNSKILFSRTLCVSSVSGTRRHYGVSMSTSRTPARQIMIASGCLRYWEDCVAAAVMSYCPQTKKKNYFDGTFQLPAEVSCEAFDILNKEPKAPCLSCKHMFFNLVEPTKTDKIFPYGNCAEPESLSNLFKNEENVKKQVEEFINGRDNNRARAKKDVICNLTGVLKQNSGFTWDTNYYSPQ
uniref:Uncharacterized protein n=1 Tax=Iconisemion striatum TaxID=60296 RepID=A0A1A7WD98_9TELE